AALEPVLASRNHDGVLPRAVRGEPGVLGRQIAFDATAGRRIKQRGVDEVHGFLFRLRLAARPSAHCTFMTMECQAVQRTAGLAAEPRALASGAPRELARAVTRALCWR